MKLIHITLFILLIGVLGCKNHSNEILISGKIKGNIPEKIEYTNPINGICNWWFKESVQPDSLGNFQINFESDKVIFTKLGTSFEQQVTLIVEPGKTYNLVLDLNQEENIFSVTDKSSIFQEAYNKLPNPFHIQDGAREFLRDSIAIEIKNRIEQRKTAEIAEFEKFLADEVISQEIFNLIKTDRNAYYDAILATTAWIKKLMAMQGRKNTFTNDFENLWKDALNQPLISNPEIVKSQWFNFYAESYIYYQEYVKGNFTKEKLEAINESGQTKSYRVNNAKEYLPAEFCEDYLANYLYAESSQKKYEKELIELFENFKSDYPESQYIPYITPIVNEIIEFHKTANSDFSEKIKFVEAYQKLNTLNEIVNILPQGKIYVDVWASWCGPCKAEFAHKKELDALLQKNDIQILYLSIDRDQDSIQWKNMIKFYNLEGFHVRANEELNTELRKIFDSKGSMSIPWYMLMDSNGEILNKRASRPSQIKELAIELNDVN